MSDRRCGGCGCHISRYATPAERFCLACKPCSSGNAAHLLAAAAVATRRHQPSPAGGDELADAAADLVAYRWRSA
jgi:hypothetical protein